MRRTLAHVGIVALALAATAGCGARAPERPRAEASPKGGDWSQFEGGHKPIDPKNARVVPETPIEITGVPYVRAVRLAWSAGTDVPSFEPDNQTLKLPPESRQAVLAVSVADLPDGADIRVDWYYGDERVFADALQSRDDGDHFFALVKRDGRRLVALPKGQYRADVSDGSKLIKTVRFEVTQ